jgi:hypothetical protein
MNERIKQLMHQAGTDCSGKWMGTNHAEKFAELIINECAALFPRVFTDEQYQRRIDKTIRNHFELNSIDEQLRERSTYFGNNP